MKEGIIGNHVICNRLIMLLKFSTPFSTTVYCPWKLSDVPPFLSISQEKFSEDLQSIMGPKRLKIFPYAPYPDKQ